MSPHYAAAAHKVLGLLVRVPPDLRFRGPFEAKSSARGSKIAPPAAQGRVFDLKCRYCGRDRRCMNLDGLVASIATAPMHVVQAAMMLGDRQRCVLRLGASRDFSTRNRIL